MAFRPRKPAGRGKQSEDQGRHLAEEVAGMLGHELRTPLTVLYTCLQLLSRVLPRDANDPARQYLDEAIVEARHMNVLTNQLLLAARIQAGELDLVRERFDLTSFARNVVDHTQPLARGQRLELAAASDVLPVWADWQHLDIALRNVLINAIDYAPGTERIRVQLRRAGEQAVIAVQDFGPGVQPQRLEHLGDPFYQTPRTDRPSRGGLGLGLFLARAITELHGGRFEVDCQEGQGCTFTMCLPLAVAAEQRVSEPVAAPARAVQRRFLT